MKWSKILPVALVTLETGNVESSSSGAGAPGIKLERLRDGRSLYSIMLNSTPAITEIQTMNGIGNNKNNPTWGSVGDEYIRRYVKSAYGPNQCKI
jgi:hypothetical protein